MSRELCAPISRRKNLLAYLEIFETKTSDVEWMIFKLAISAVGKTMEGWDTEA
jgi:hypothetical protein